MDQQLSEYEARQVREIAAWKASMPNLLNRLVEVVTWPIAKLIEQAIPVSAVGAGLDAAYRTAEYFVEEEDIKRQAGVPDITELRHRPLEECDRLAMQVSLGSQAVGVVEGAATGAGGFWTAVLDPPVLLVLALRTIQKIGLCYGYPLRSDRDRRYVLAIMVVAGSDTSAERAQRLDKLRNVEDWVIEQTEESVALDSVVDAATQVVEFEGAPVVGGLAGIVINYAFIRRVDAAARRIFQERWLRDNHKVDVIEPARDGRVGVSLLQVATGSIGSVGYAAGYGVGIGVALPALLAASAVSALDGAVARGFRDGADAARHDAEQRIAHGRERRSSAPPALHAAAAPA